MDLHLQSGEVSLGRFNDELGRFEMQGFQMVVPLDGDLAMTPFERGLVAHLIADWILQNDWMARNKVSLRHPAAWTHAGIQALCLGLALGSLAGLVLGFIHLLIDTRVPLDWWIRFFKKSDQAPEAGSIAIWLDQTYHIVCVAVWVALVRN